MEDLKSGIVIIGYNKLARSVIDILELINTYNISGIIDIKENTTPFITEYTVFDDLKTLLVLRKDKNIKYVIICVQDSKHKKEISESINSIILDNLSCFSVPLNSVRLEWRSSI